MVFIVETSEFAFGTRRMVGLFYHLCCAMCNVHVLLSFARLQIPILLTHNIFSKGMWQSLSLKNTVWYACSWKSELMYTMSW